MSDIHSVALSLRGDHFQLQVTRLDGQLDLPVTINLEGDQQLIFCQPNGFYIHTTTAPDVSAAMVTPENVSCLNFVKTEPRVKEEPQYYHFHDSQLTLGDLLRPESLSAGNYLSMGEDSMLLDAPGTEVPSILNGESEETIAEHQCRQCGKRFKSSYNLHRHTRVHTRIKPFVCDSTDCNYSCSSASDLCRHNLKHTGVKSFRCDFSGCNFVCSQSCNLTEHKRRHLGIKPYICDFSGCTYRAVAKKDLTLHKRKHTGVKPYICDVAGCNYSCSQPGNFAQHKRRHLGIKPFRCDVAGCKYSCSHAGNFAQHKIRHLDTPFTTYVQSHEEIIDQD